MTKTLKQLQEENPGFGSSWDPDRRGGMEQSRPDGEFVPHDDFKLLTAAKREDEARIAELTQRDPDWYDASPADTFAMLAKARAQLTAEQQAHAETKRQLEEVDEAVIALMNGEANFGECVPEEAYHAALARQASINRPTDNSPMDDRGEGEK